MAAGGSIPSSDVKTCQPRPSQTVSPEPAARFPIGFLRCRGTTRPAHRYPCWDSSLQFLQFHRLSSGRAGHTPRTRLRAREARVRLPRCRRLPSPFACACRIARRPRRRLQTLRPHRRNEAHLRAVRPDRVRVSPSRTPARDSDPWLEGGLPLSRPSAYRSPFVFFMRSSAASAWTLAECADEMTSKVGRSRKMEDGKSPRGGTQE